MLLEGYCARPSGTVDAPGPWNPVPAEQARMGGTSCTEAKRLVLLEDQVVVGFALSKDFEVLGLNPPSDRVRDVQKYYTEEVCIKLDLRGRLPHHSGPYGLSDLTEAVFSIRIQEGAHNALQDARAAMALWEFYYSKAKNHNLPRKKLLAQQVLARNGNGLQCYVEKLMNVL